MNPPIKITRITRITFSTKKLNRLEYSLLISKSPLKIGKEYFKDQWAMYKVLSIDSNTDLKRIFDKLDFSVTTYQFSNDIIPEYLLPDKIIFNII